MGLLQKVTFSFTERYKEFYNQFFALFSNVLKAYNTKYVISSSNDQYYPRVIIESVSSGDSVIIKFDGSELNEKVIIRNETGVTKESYEKYSAIDLEDLKIRFLKNNIEIIKLDHIGFNLPWFQGGIHPRIQNLRHKLTKKCLYHKYPSGEPWDFILPGTEDEILHQISIDYSLIRKPKIELVSFEKSSIPIIQFDVGGSCKKTHLQEIFPEGLYDQYLGNIWICVKNPFDVDLFIVLGEEHAGDWSNYLKDNRID